MRYLFYMSLLVALVLVACQPAASPGATTIAATTLPTSSAADTRLTLKSCSINGIDAECGYLHVPEDRNHPNGRTLDLKIVVVRASGPDRQPDPLFYIAGGPDIPVTSETIVDFVHNYGFSKVNVQRDLVFLDQRGINDKHRLTCDPFPTEIDDATSQGQVDDWVKKCLAMLDGDPRFYTTLPAMQDLDEARAALGYDKINVYGISYGAQAVQVYARMFPEHVRAAVADHGLALDLPFMPTWPRAAQSALDQVFTYCDQDEKCHAAYPDIRGELKAVLNRLAQGPVITSYTPPGGTEPVQMTKIDLENGFNQLMRAGTYGQIPFIIHMLATNADWTQLAKTSSEQHPGSANSAKAEPFLVMRAMVYCFDPAEVFGSAGTALRDTDSFYYDAFLHDALYWKKVCAALPEPDPALIYGPGKLVPVSMLMLNSLLDPIYPPSSIEPALKEFTQSRVVVEPTEGHDGQYPPECRWNIIAQYIQQGSVDGLDVSCLEKQNPSFVIGK
jgi:pimeloyl-ACP methyl ester carboxylesterase